MQLNTHYHLMWLIKTQEFRVAVAYAAAKSNREIGYYQIWSAEKRKLENLRSML